MMVSLPQQNLRPSKSTAFVFLVLFSLILCVFFVAKNYDLNAARGKGPKAYAHFIEKSVWNEREWLRNSSDEPYSLGCYNYRPVRSGKGPKVQEKSYLDLKGRHCVKRLPSVFIIGVKKCGSTTLTTFLDLHPQIATAFKASIKMNLALDVVVHKYHKMMPYAEPTQTVVASFPGYYANSRDRFFQLLPFLPKNPKIIVILRDPVARAVSDYVHITVMKEPSTSSNRTEWNHVGNILKSTFDETVLTQNGKVNDTLDIIRQGIYSKGLPDFVNAVSRKNILILSGDYFSKNPVHTLRKVENFLGLQFFFKNEHFHYNAKKHFYCAHVTSRPDVRCMSERKGRTHPNISEVVLTKLRSFYRPYNLRLGREFKLSPVEFEWTLR